jgi:hypothetical protein
MPDYPLLSLESLPTTPEERASLAAKEFKRAWIANNYGLERLAVHDQFERAIDELGVQGDENRTWVFNEIDNALAMFKFRGFSAGDAPPPAKIRKAIKRISESAKHISSDLKLIASARRGSLTGEEPWAKTLEQIHHLILGSIAENALPSPLRRKYSDDDIADAMPKITLLQDNPDWVNGFARIGHSVQKIHEAFDARELARPTQGIDAQFAAFIGRLGEIYKEITGKRPAAPDPSGGVGGDWRGPFSRFVKEIWPLTPEGSGGLGGDQNCPTNRRIREALKASVVLPVVTEG